LSILTQISLPNTHHFLPYDYNISLLKNGADQSIRNNNFENEQSIIEKPGHTEMATLLKNNEDKETLFGIF